ncbi:fructose-6-phosphate aldolase [candidate division KSB1 bacterium]|nr:fructose-6-phosphate aldolase [candidate division KSB1 bacterium]
MKFFIDSASVEEVKNAVRLGVADGVTTNPTLLARENKPAEVIYKELCKVVKGPVCAEAVSIVADDIIAESRKLSAIDENIVVKIPATKDGLIAVNQLESEGIKTNVTLIFSPMQALLAARAGATYVCPFVGRLDDAGHVGMELIEQIMQIFINYDLPTQVVVASVRGTLHVSDAAMIGAHIVTVPYNVIEKLIKHPLTDAGIQTFLKDWQKVKASS